MTNELDNSNLDNNTPKEGSIIEPQTTTEAENKNSSNLKADTDSSTDALVDSIVKQEGDEVLAIEDQGHSSELKKPWYHWLLKKPVLITAIVILIIAVIAAIPYTRYKLLGLVSKQNYSLQVIDSQTKQPISDVQMSIRGIMELTDNQGRAKVKVKLGKTVLSLKKTYYKSLTFSVLVGIRNRNHIFLLKATGRQVPITIVNKISNQPVANARVAAAGSTVQTNQKGSATIVLPANAGTVSATINANGFNNLSSSIVVTTSKVSANQFSLVPAGKIYFLSNATGTIDVISTNLDGSNRQTVLAGTGNEDPNNTQLLMTSDGQYVALLSRRSGSSPSVYLIDASNNQLTTIDSGNANFSLVGWDGHYLIYTVSRNDIESWQPDQNAIKSYDADTGHLSILDQTTASGTSSLDQQAQQFDGVTLLANGSILYDEGWTLGSQALTSLSSLQGHIYTINPDGSSKKTVYNINVPSGAQAYGIYPSSVQYGPNSVYITDGFGDYYNYVNGQFSTDTSLTNDGFNQLENTAFYNTTTGMESLWSYVRDGQNVIYVSSSSTPNGQTVATLNGLTPYSWYSSSYILLTKTNSQLFIMPASGLSTNQSPLKVTDYFANGYAQQ